MTGLWMPRFSVPMALLAATALTGCAAIPEGGPAQAPLGGSWPGRTPELFAPGVVDTGGIEIHLVFDKACTEVFFARRIDGTFAIHTSRPGPDGWTMPEKLDLFPDDPAAEAADGSLWFVTDRPGSRSPRDLHGARPRAGGGFEAPVSIAPPLHTDRGKGDTVVAPDESYMVLTAARPCGQGRGDPTSRSAPRTGGGASPGTWGPRSTDPRPTSAR